MTSISNKCTICLNINIMIAEKIALNIHKYEKRCRTSGTNTKENLENVKRGWFFSFLLQKNRTQLKWMMKRRSLTKLKDFNIKRQVVLTVSANVQIIFVQHIRFFVLFEQVYEVTEHETIYGQKVCPVATMPIHFHRNWKDWRKKRNENNKADIKIGKNTNKRFFSIRQIPIWYICNSKYRHLKHKQ